MDWYFESYDIEISKSGVISKTFHIVNYANKNSSFNGTQFKVACEIADQAFIIRAQEVDGRRVHETARTLFWGQEIIVSPHMRPKQKLCSRFVPSPVHRFPSAAFSGFRPNGRMGDCFRTTLCLTIA